MRLLLISIGLVIVAGFNNAILHAQLSDKIHEQLQFNYITIDEGLNNNRVRGLEQDNYGFIWIGTQFGISRFDGYTVKRYDYFYSDTSATEFDFGETREIFCDSRNTLWAIGRYGICYFDWTQDRFEQFFHQDLTVSISSGGGIAEDENGQLWFGTNRGLLMLNPATNNLILYEQAADDPKSPAMGNMDKIIITSENHVWYSTFYNGVGYLNQETGIFHHFNSSDDSTSLAENRVERLHLDKEGTVWVGHTNNGISKYSYTTNSFSRLYPEPGRKEAGRVRGILEDSQGNFWIGTQAGLYLFDKTNESFKRYAYADHPISALSHNSIQTMMEDNHEGLWIGTFAGGVSYTNLNSSGIIKFDYSRIASDYYLNDRNVYSLAFDGQENIWVGTEAGGLNFLDRKTGKFQYFMEGPGDENTRSNNIKDIAVDENGLVWFGTYRGGMSYYNPATGKFRHYQQREEFPQGLVDETVFVVYPDEIDNNLTWVGSTDRLYAFDEKAESFTHILPETPGFENTPEISRIYRICTNSENTMFIGGADMLLLLDRNTNTFSSITQINDIPIGQVDFVFLDKYEFLWAGINSSFLVRYDYRENSFLVFDESKGIAKAQYSEGIDDEFANIWLSSNNGLYKLENIIETPDSFTVTHYDRSDNIQSLEYLYHSRAKSATGEIAFGGINGFNLFRPDKVKPNPFVPQVAVTRLLIDGEEVNPGMDIYGEAILEQSILETKKLHFNHKIKLFSFNFSAFHFVSPGNNKFKYILEGYDKDWNYVDANSRAATYSNIPKGKYVFKVDATNNNGKWSGAPFEIQVRITPPFWKRIWFYILLILLVSFLVYSFVKGREAKTKKDRELLQSKIHEGEIELERRKEEMDQQSMALKEKEAAEFEYNWVNSGLAKFSEIMSKEKGNLERLSSKVITNIVEYVEASQGGMYFLNDSDSENIHLELVASYAYSEEKLDKSQFYPSEGLVGSCFETKKKLEIDNLPEGYTKLESGLGKTQPKFLVLIPLLLDDDVLGVIELASFKKLENYKTDFVSKLGESIASIVITAKANDRVKEMYDQTQIQAEELLAQEEEMKQSLEELQATQEEASRREEKLQDKLEKMEKSFAETLKEKDLLIKELKNSLKKK